MARTTFQISSQTSLTDFCTKANTALALLTNPIIRGAKIRPVRSPRRAAFEWTGLFTYDTGGSAIATPWTLTGYQETSLPSLVTDLSTFYTTNSTYFIAAPFYFDVFNSEDPSKLEAFVAIVLSNSTSGASANFTPLVIG